MLFRSFGLVIFLNKKEGKGALQVTSMPSSAVYLNGKFQGDTPLCKCEGNVLLKTGEYSLKLIPKDGNFHPFEDKIIINKATLSVVDRTFGNDAESEGSTITLSEIEDKKDSQLLVLSFPDKATISLDNNPVGISPMLLKNVTESDHELSIVKDGYREKIIRIRTVAGYKLTSLVFLGLSLEPTASSAALPQPSPSPLLSVQKIIILNTPTGFLRVREDAKLGSLQVGQVIPGDIFELLDEKNGWFKIKLSNEKLGWVSSDYAKKQ